jgi:hypothetical protein
LGTTKSSGGRWIGIAMAILIGGLGLFWTLRDRGDGGDAEREVAAVEVRAEEDRPRTRFDGNEWRDVTPPTRERSSAEREAALLSGAPTIGPTPRYPSGRTVSALDVYRTMSAYPPDSRPLEPERHHEVHELVPAQVFPNVPRRSIDLVFVIEFTYDGATRPARAALSALWAPPGAQPTRFTGTFRDAVEAGSLAIYVGVEVTEPGFFNVDANLWGEGEAPVAWTKWRGDLTPGLQEIRLSFFGKALVDSSAAPPFRLEQLRGFRYAESQSPAVQPMDAYPGAYVCASREGFVDAEWDDPMRQERIAELERVEGQGGNPPVPLESFLGNLPPERRAREAERLGVDPNDFTAEALSRIELPPEEPEM